jgi:FMN-dependent NADH-azoreductase
VKLLEIQSSPRGESSDSISLTKSFIEACKSDNGSIVVGTLNVWHERLPEFDYEGIGAKYKAVTHEKKAAAHAAEKDHCQAVDVQRLCKTEDFSGS